tara:strand:- start:239 stop:478 length:240 start_codon:yes stop_codon:yes gene_type:complete
VLQRSGGELIKGVIVRGEDGEWAWGGEDACEVPRNNRSDERGERRDSLRKRDNVFRRSTVQIDLDISVEFWTAQGAPLL